MLPIFAHPPLGHRSALLAAALLACLGLPGCLASGVYRTARTLEKGEGDMNLTFSAFQIGGAETTTTVNGTKTTTKEPSITIPNVIPEFAYHIGVTDDLEVGGRAALGSVLLEIDAKYRFLRSGDLHMALAPALGFRALGPIEGISATLPVIATYDLNDTLALNLAPYVGYSSLNSTDKDLSGISGNFLSVGGSAGVQLRGRTFHFMPSVDISQTLVTLSDKQSSESSRQRFVIFSLTMGWVSGRELKKLENIEDKLDKMDKKLDSGTSPK